MRTLLSTALLLTTTALLALPVASPAFAQDKAVVKLLMVGYPDSDSVDAVSGNTVPGTAAGNFFNAGTVTNPVTAATLRLDSAVLNDPLKIAASGNANGPTDNSVAQGLAGLRIADDTVTWTSSTGATESGSFLSFFRSMVTRIGIDSAAATDNATLLNANNYIRITDTTAGNALIHALIEAGGQDED